MEKNYIKCSYAKREIRYTFNKDEKTVSLHPDDHARILGNTIKKRKKEPLDFNQKWDVFKKIGGTNFSQILGLCKYNTPFSAWCNIMGMGLPFEDNKYTIAGKVLEPKIIDYMQKIVDKKGFKIQTEDPKDIEFDFFKDIDTSFGGMPDGRIVEMKTLIECKVQQEKKRKDWDNRIPINYEYQTMLYTNLLKYTKYTFPVLFLKPEEYDNPEKVVITKDNIKFYSFNYDEGLNDFTERMKRQAMEWYAKHIIGNVSPSTSDEKPLPWESQQDKLIDKLGLK